MSFGCFFAVFCGIVDAVMISIYRLFPNKLVRFRSTGHLKSTKERAEVRGIGTGQIQKTAERHWGFVTYRRENYEFTTLVTIKLAS